MEPGLMCQDVSNMNRANLAKFPDSVLESQATVQMIILEEFVNLIVYLDRISDRFVPLMVPGNLIQSAKEILGKLAMVAKIVLVLLEVPEIALRRL